MSFTEPGGWESAIDPEDALAVYRTLVDTALIPRNNAAYERALGYVKSVRELTERLHGRAAFAEYVLGLRGEYKRLRNFLAFVEKEFGVAKERNEQRVPLRGSR